MQTPPPVSESSSHPMWLVIVLIAVGFVLPAAFYWSAGAGVPSVSPARARQELVAQGAAAALVDVRSTVEYRQGHAEAAVNWPYAEIAHHAPLPESLAGKRLYLICNSGIQSARAARILTRATPAVSAVSVQGGMIAWISRDGSSLVGCCGAKPAASDTTVPFRESPRFEQWTAVITGFVIKPVYMVLSLVLIVVLWRRRETDLRALRWSLVFFLLGEIFCAVNYLFFHDGSVLSEYLHSYGMTVAFGFATFALIETADHRLLRFTDPQKPCSLLEMCGPCSKYNDAACGLRRLLLFALPCVLVVALMPLFAQPRTISYNTLIWGAVYNYSHPVVYQLFEIRYLPVMAAMLIGGAWIALLRRAVNVSKVLFAAAIGAFGFGLFRLLLLDAYETNLLWFNTWEELTELIAVVGIAWTLWVFRRGLFRVSGQS